MNRKTLIRAFALIVASAFAVWLWVGFQQRGHFKAAETFRSQSKWKLAIREYDAAMHFYTPFSPYIGKSAEQLWRMGEMLEEEGRPDWAKLAYSSIRSSFYASRSFYTPGRDWIERCDEKISALDVKRLIEDGDIAPSREASEREKILRVLRTDRPPSVFWSAASGAGFSGWVVAVLFFAFFGFENGGKLRARNALYGALLFSSAFALWVIALLKA